MSEEDDNAAGETGASVFDNSRRTREQRIKDFLEAAGMTLNDMLESVRKNPILEDAVTEAHRDCVIDLRASGASEEAVARFFKITKEKCRRLFAWELENGRHLRTGQVTRALLTNGVLLGDTSALLGYLKNQPEEEWGTKHSQKNMDEAPPTEESIQSLAANEAFIAGITAGLAVDTTKYKKPSPRASNAPTPPKKQEKRGAVGVVRKPKADSSAS